MCPVCSSSHSGPCPQMPKPPQKLEVLELTGWVNQTRSRSNGLISRSTSNDEVPQRSRSNGVLSKESSTSSSLAIQEMKQEVMKSGQMAPTLKDFVVKVFNNQEIMKGPDHVARMIYEMYSSGEEGGGKAPAMKAAKAFFVNIWWTAMQYPILTKGKLQYGNERLKDIVDIILKVNAQGYTFEAANPRHEHEWEEWKRAKIADDKVLLPGVITQSTVLVEHPELVAQRLVRFAGLVGKENLIAGTDCGFAQSQATRRVHPSVMWAKLGSLVEGARLASSRLWK